MPDSIITSLIEDFSKYTLSLKACPADEIGQAYEYLVGKFADDAGNTAQEFYTIEQSFNLWLRYCNPNRMKVFMTRLAVLVVCWSNA